MIGIAFLAYALLTWLRPRLALWVLLFVIPFGHLVRFSVAGVPFIPHHFFSESGAGFTFPEAAVYVLAMAIGLRTTVYRLQRPTPPRPPSQREGEKKNSFPTSHREGGRRGGGGLTPYALRLTSRLRDPWLLLPLLWVLVAVVAAVGSPAGVRAWGIWKAYFLAPVVLFWVMRAALRQWFEFSARRQMTNVECRMTNQSPISNDQNFLRLTSYVLLPLAAGAFVVAAIAIVQRWWPIGVPYPWSLPGKFRATSVFGYPNAVGLYLAPLVPLFVGAAFSYFASFRASNEKSHMAAGASNNVRSLGSGLGMTRPFYSLFLLLTSAIAIVAIALARSTGALAALAAVFPVFLFSTWRAGPQRGNPTHFGDRRNGWDARRGARRAVGVVLVWVLTSLLLTAWLPYHRERTKWGPPIVQKLTFQRWSGSVRLSQYRETWQLLRDHPIRGAGLAAYQQAIAPYHEDPRVEIFLYPHNLLLAVWVELGLAGLLIFLATMYQFFRIALRLYGSTALRLASVASMLVILVHGLVDVPYFKNDLAMLFWVIVALGIAASAGKPGDHLTAAASPPMLPSR